MGVESALAEEPRAHPRAGARYVQARILQPSYKRQLDPAGNVQQRLRHRQAELRRRARRAGAERSPMCANASHGTTARSSPSSTVRTRSRRRRAAGQGSTALAISKPRPRRAAQNVNARRTVGQRSGGVGPALVTRLVDPRLRVPCPRSRVRRPFFGKRRLDAHPRSSPRCISRVRVQDDVEASVEASALASVEASVLRERVRFCVDFRHDGRARVAHH